MVQQAGPTDPDTCGDVVERRAVVADLGKAVQRLVDDQIAGRQMLARVYDHAVSLTAFAAGLPTSR